MRSKIARVCNNHPDICAAVAFFSEVTVDTFDKSTYKVVNKIIKHIQKTIYLGLLFPQLDLTSLYILVYSDAFSTAHLITKVNMDTLSFSWISTTTAALLNSAVTSLVELHVQVVLEKQLLCPMHLMVILF